jgi:hypothetical protein
MNFIGWNIVLYALKWVFIGLIYISLAILLMAVRREMSLRLKESRRLASTAPGRLRVLEVGKDKILRPGAVLPLLPQTSLGAKGENDIVLTDPYVSGTHARLYWDGVTWWVEDLGSRNGTYVNRNPCRPRTPQQVAPGVNIQIGDTVFELLD